MKDDEFHSPYIRHLMETNASLSAPQPLKPPESNFQRGFRVGVAWGFWVGIGAALLWIAVIEGFVRGGL